MRKSLRILIVLLLVLGLCLSSALVYACTDIMVGKDASADGSVIGTYCCDGAMYAKLEVIPGEQHAPGTMIPLYYRPYGVFDELYEGEDIYLGEMPQVEETYRYIVQLVYIDDQWNGGINEHGVSVGETTIGGRRELRGNPNTWLWVYSNFEETSLMSLALQRAKTAREAIQIMGELAETYGYRQSGEHVTVIDGTEAWAFEIFGPGQDWAQESGKPGAVWAAQRIPDDHVGVSANASRIGELGNDPDYFMYSSNAYDLAEEMGWWNPGEPFFWYQVYGGRDHSISLREWSFFNMVAPSYNIEPTSERIPFSVKPDSLLSVQDVIALHRDYFTGIEGLDVTMDPAYQVDGEKSPMASPFGPSELHKLLGIKTSRHIATNRSVFVNVTQVKGWLPDPVKGVIWYGAGPGASTLHVPIYSGVTELPDAWGYTPKTYYDRASAWWAFRLIDGLSLIKWQVAMEDIKAVRDPAEAAFFAMQNEVESKAVELYDAKQGWGGEKAAKEFVTRYTNQSMSAVSDAYWELFDYMLFKYYFVSGEYVSRILVPHPVVEVPNVEQILRKLPPIGPPQGPPMVPPGRR